MYVECITSMNFWLPIVHIHLFFIIIVIEYKILFYVKICINVSKRLSARFMYYPKAVCIWASEIIRLYILYVLSIWQKIAIICL